MDPHGVRKAVRGCATIFHLGALIAISYLYVHPFDFVQANVVGTAHLLNACLDNEGLERIIHTSTSEVYGTAQYTPIDEKHPLQAQSPYAASKIAAAKREGQRGDRKGCQHRNREGPLHWGVG